jgi:hypothetical protein
MSRLGDSPEAAAALQGHEEKPDVWHAPLEDALKTAGAQDDPEIIAAASRLMRLIDPTGAEAGKYKVINAGAVYGQTIGDRNVVTQNFGGVGGAVGDPKAL